MGVGVTCALLVFLADVPFHAAYERLGGHLHAAAKAAPPPPEVSTHVFSAEEITQIYAERVLEIKTTWRVPHGMWFWKSEEPEGSEGSGVLLANSAEEGIIVTNFHVVSPSEAMSEGSYQCGARQDNSQSYTEAAFVARAKPPLDLALLAVALNSKNWSPGSVPIQSLKKLPQGEPVVAIGNALGEGLSTTNGIISHFDQLDANGRWCIRTSTPISPGNSGGPLITERGAFYAGITTASRTTEGAQNYNMAIPAEYLLEPGNWDFANADAQQLALPLLETAREHEQR